MFIHIGLPILLSLEKGGCSIIYFSLMNEDRKIIRWVEQPPVSVLS